MWLLCKLQVMQLLIIPTYQCIHLYKDWKAPSAHGDNGNCWLNYIYMYRQQTTDSKTLVCNCPSGVIASILCYCFYQARGHAMCTNKLIFWSDLMKCCSSMTWFIWSTKTFPVMLQHTYDCVWCWADHWITTMNAFVQMWMLTSTAKLVVSNHSGFEA